MEERGLCSETLSRKGWQGVGEREGLEKCFRRKAAVDVFKRASRGSL